MKQKQWDAVLKKMEAASLPDKPKCPFCKSEFFDPGRIVAVSDQSGKPGTVVGTVSHVGGDFMAEVICRKCGFVLLFARSRVNFPD